MGNTMIRRLIKTGLKKVSRKTDAIASKMDFFDYGSKNTFGITEEEIKFARKHDFLPDEYAIEHLNKDNYGEYLTEYERMVFRKRNQEKTIVFDNKILFYHVIKNFADTNTMYCYSKNKVFVSLCESFSKENFADKLKEKQKLVYKCDGRGGGDGFHLLEYKDEKFYMDRHICEPSEILKLLDSDNYLVEEHCTQSEFENQFCNASLNTLRIITLREDSDKYVCVCGIQRMGANLDSCLDSASQGGIYALVDLESGKLSAARSHNIKLMNNEDGSYREFDVHPVTGAQIKGVVIPDWENLKKQIEDLHKKIAFIQHDFIAWDVALTPNGFKIIEANASCSWDFLQIFGGVRNKTIGKWMKKHG